MEIEDSGEVSFPIAQTLISPKIHAVLCFLVLIGNAFVLGEIFAKW
jgi:hypothetical protein